jgi:hypothetical protein
LVTVAENFLIAKGKVLFAYLFFAAAPFQVLAIYLYHDTLLSVVITMGVSGAILAMIGFGMMWRTLSTERTSRVATA